MKLLAVHIHSVCNCLGLKSKCSPKYFHLVLFYEYERPSFTHKQNKLNFNFIYLNLRLWVEDK